MVLKWPFIGDSLEETLYIYCSGLLGDRGLDQCHGYTWLFIDDNGEDSSHLGLLRGRTWSWWSFTLKMVLKRLFIGHTDKYGLEKWVVIGSTG